MKNIVFLLFCLAVIIYGLHNSLQESDLKKQRVSKSAYLDKKSLKKDILESNEYILNYIVDIINNGSDSLGFKGGVMEGGYASKEDAKKIACYVLELSGRKCPYPYSKDAQMYFTSICGGCHGNDGKGIKGIYPDLTRKKLLGIAQKENELSVKR